MRISQADISERVTRILCDRLIIILDRFAQVRTGPLLREKFSFEIKLVSFRIHRRCFRDRALLRAGKPCLQRLGDRFRDFAFDCENIRQFPIVSVSPKMCVGESVDELHIHPDLIARFLHAAFQNVGHPKLLRDLGKIVRCAFEMLRRCARNYFQIRDFGQPRQDFILHAFAKVSVVGIATKVVEWQHCDRFIRDRCRGRRSR